jgi:hypothetical protein
VRLAERSGAAAAMPRRERERGWGRGCIGAPFGLYPHGVRAGIRTSSRPSPSPAVALRVFHTQAHLQALCPSSAGPPDPSLLASHRDRIETLLVAAATQAEEPSSLRWALATVRGALGVQCAHETRVVSGLRGGLAAHAGWITEQPPLPTGFGSGPATAQATPAAAAAPGEASALISAHGLPAVPAFWPRPRRWRLDANRVQARRPRQQAGSCFGLGGK